MADRLYGKTTADADRLLRPTDVKCRRPKRQVVVGGSFLLAVSRSDFRVKGRSFGYSNSTPFFDYPIRTVERVSGFSAGLKLDGRKVENFGRAANQWLSFVALHSTRKLSRHIVCRVEKGS